MRNLLRLVVSGLIALLASAALGHGGGLDACGGHNDRKTGGYHVHNQAKYCACYPTAPGCAGSKANAATTPEPAPQQLGAVGQAQANVAQTVYVTKTGTKYHRAGCRSLAKSSIPMALKEASARYGPCSICGPPTIAAGTTPPQPRTGATTATKPQPVGGQCAATTKKGTRCSRAAAAGSSYCWQHGGK